MFKKKRAILGLDFSNGAVKLVEIVRDPLPQIRRLAAVDHANEIFGEGMEPDWIALQQAVEHLYQTQGFKGRMVNISVPSQFVVIRQLTLPNLSIEELRHVIQFELKNSIHLPFDEAVFDIVKVESKLSRDDSLPDVILHNKLEKSNNKNTAVDPQRKKWWNESFKKNRNERNKSATLAECEVILVAAPKKIVENIITMIKAIGLKASSIDIGALSIDRVLLSYRNPNSTFLIVEIDPRVVYVHIFHEGLLRVTRTIPLSFDQFDKHSKSTETYGNVTFGRTDSIIFSQTERFTESLESHHEVAATHFDESDSKQNDLHKTHSTVNQFPEISTHHLDIRLYGLELANELERSMNFIRYTLNYRDAEVSQVILTGFIPDDPMILQFITENVGVQANYIPYTDSFLDLSLQRQKFPKFTEFEFSRNINYFTVPIGLALKEVGFK